jgi:hypothetical protein
MYDVFFRTEEKFGYKINHISGRTEYIVSRYNQEINEKGRLKSLEYVELGRYDNLEEAQANAEGSDSIDSFERDDYYAIISKDGSNATGKVYPTRERAFIDLLELLGDRVPLWCSWNVFKNLESKYTKLRYDSMLSNSNNKQALISGVLKQLYDQKVVEGES